MKVLLPCSIGEATDRYLILLKKQEVATGAKREAISVEIADLRDAIENALIGEVIKETDAIRRCDMACSIENLMKDADVSALDKINRKLWDLEDQIRLFYKSGFIHTKTAYAVCELNDERSRLKQSINSKFGTQYHEFKQYANG